MLILHAQTYIFTPFPDHGYLDQAPPKLYLFRKQRCWLTNPANADTRLNLTIDQVRAKTTEERKCSPPKSEKYGRKERNQLTLAAALSCKLTLLLTSSMAPRKENARSNSLKLDKTSANPRSTLYISIFLALMARLN